MLVPSEMTRDHWELRRRINRHLPSIASRVFALRNKSYRGSGVHYHLEAYLGWAISRVNSVQTPIEFQDPVIDRLRFEDFLRKLVVAEFSARGWNFPGK